MESCQAGRIFNAVSSGQCRACSDCQRDFCSEPNGWRERSEEGPRYGTDARNTAEVDAGCGRVHDRVEEQIIVREQDRSETPTAQEGRPQGVCEADGFI